MNKPHKHAELIKAWADGAEIETREAGLWIPVTTPQWFKYSEYRIKPEEKKPVVRWLWASSSDGRLSPCFLTENKAKDYGWEIKLEWSRTEFPE